MAKKQNKPYAGDPGDEHIEKNVVEAPVMEAPPVEKQPKRKEPAVRMIDGWEVKDRMYRLTNGMSPLSYAVSSRGKYYFDEEKGHEREIMLTENQNTPFVDEFKGQIRPGRIMFRDGILSVPRNKIMKQKFLSLYHPARDKMWYEVKPKQKAVTELETLDLQLDAMVAARTMEIDMIEAIMRVEVGSSVSKMSSKELKRDILLLARENPKLVLDLMADDNIMLRNIGIKAVEQNILSLSGDQRTLSYASNGRKLFSIPFDEHPYSALAAWFKTDEGMGVLKTVEKQLV